MGREWERLNEWYVVGIVKEEGGHITFHSMWETEWRARKAYRDLLKDESITCLVFCSKVVASMDKIVRYVMDHSGKEDPHVMAKILGHNSNRKVDQESFYRNVTQHVKALVEEEDKHGK